MIASILVLLDGRPTSDAAVSSAMTLGAAIGSEVHGLFVEDEKLLTAIPNVTALSASLGTAAMPTPLPDKERREIEELFAQRGETAYNTFDAAQRSAGATGTFDRYRGPVPETMIAAARTRGLVVMGCRRSSDDKGATNPGTKIEPILRGSTRPMLLVPAGAPLTVAGDTPEVLLAYDGSNAATRALPWTGWLARLFSASITIITIAEHGLDVAEQQDEATAFLTPFGRPIRRETGSSWRDLVDLATDRKPIAGVMGAFGQNRIREFFFGSMTQNVLHNLPCPWLLVRP